MSRLFRKTALGIATYSKPDHGLTQPQRALLILIDGKRTAAQLRKFGSSFGDVNAVLGELYRVGLIELDPEYERLARAMLESMQKEAKEFSSPLESATMIGGTFARVAVAPSAMPNRTPAQAAQGKRDLRDLANPGVLESEKDETAAAISEAMLHEAKKCATRYVLDTLGNSGAPLRFALDRADTIDRFNEVLVIAKNTLRDMKSMSVANELQRQVDEIFNT